MERIRLIVLGCVVLFLTSCSYKNKQVLFKSSEKISTSKNEPLKTINPKIYPNYHICKENDVITVRVLNNETSPNAFDKVALEREGAKFTVHNGVITLPIVGEVKVLGLSKPEIITTIRSKLAEHIIDPIVDVEFVSLSINVLGEVNRPGKYLINEETSVVDGLGLAGGITTYGIIKNVKIIRGDKVNPEITVVDITKLESLKSNKLILKDGDIIYVEPRRVKQFASQVKPYLFLTGIFSSAVTIFVVVTRNR